MNRYKLAALDRGFDGTSLATATITIYPSLAAAESTWRAAVEHCACFVFQTFEWNATWRETVGRTEPISEHVVHVAAADGRTLMLLPLAIRQTQRLRVLEFLGGSLTDYNAPLIDADFARTLDERDFVRLWRTAIGLLPKLDVVWLVRMPETVDGAPNPLIGLSWVRHTDDAYAATLPDSFKEFTATRSTQFFAQIRRHRRRLEKHGSVDVSFPSEAGERLDVIRVLAEQKSSWLRSNGYENTFERSATREFYERLTTSQPQTGRILVACLRVGDQIAATLWGAVFGRRYYFLLPSYGEQWKNYSAGRILTESVLQRCIDQGDVNVFDLTIGDEGYKRVWSDHALALHEYLEARTVKGFAFVWYRRLRSAVRSNRRIRELTRAWTSRLRIRATVGRVAMVGFAAAVVACEAGA
jgi:CelD/BcsL family acetyltransferase involved in cellulose biosynthesis